MIHGQLLILDIRPDGTIFISTHGRSDQQLFELVCFQQLREAARREEEHWRATPVQETPKSSELKDLF